MIKPEITMADLDRIDGIRPVPEAPVPDSGRVG
jgi:hypothetical protein